MILFFFAIGGVGLLILAATFLLGEAVDTLMDGVGPDYLSGTALSAFLATLGFVGAWVLDSTGSMPAASAAGVVGGLGVGWLTGWASSSLMKGGDESTVKTGGLQGLTGNVVSAIPEAGMGQVSVVASGHITRLNARADVPLAAGEAVIVTGVLSPTSVIVEPAPARTL